MINCLVRRPREGTCVLQQHVSFCLILIVWHVATQLKNHTTHAHDVCWSGWEGWGEMGRGNAQHSLSLAHVRGGMLELGGTGARWGGLRWGVTFISCDMHLMLH